ncbi:tetratricopeptide repeat protein [Thermodesulfobacteriota bacterium]
MLKPSGKLQNILLTALIASIAFASFLPVLNSGFVWDDIHNIVENNNYRGLSLSHLYWIFTTLHDNNYHPLAWLTFSADYIVWGMNPAGYHLTNLVIHVLNAVLFYYLMVALLQRFTDVSDDSLFGVRVSAVVGALFFAVHPLRVETVAWISTRGDLPCNFFYLLTILAYMRMVDNEAPDKRRKWYLLALFFFILSLLSRAWGVTLPLVLLVLDVYPFRRFSFNRQSLASIKSILIEKIPFVLLAILAGIQALWAKKVGMINLADHHAIDRLAQAAYGLCFYLGKTVMPIRLSPLYLLEKNFDAMAPQYLMCTLLICGITAGLFLMRHRWPWAITAWICYAVTVGPLLGFAQSGLQIAADRYTYIACLPFGVLAGAGLLKLWLARQKLRSPSVVWFSILPAIFLGLAVLSTLSFRQSRIWHNSVTLWSYVIQVDSTNYVAYYNRGVVYKDKGGDLTKALKDYNTAIALYPEFKGCILDKNPRSK